MRYSIRYWLGGILGLCFSVTVLAAELTISAAASLTQAFQELAPVFEAGNPGIKLRFNFGGSGALAQQILKGAPVDVLASADQESMDLLQQQGFVSAATRHNFAGNQLVLVVPRAFTPIPTQLSDLPGSHFRRIAIGAPASVPAGRYTRTVLQKAALWEPLTARFIGAQSVRQVLDYVARGEVDAGFVYATDAAMAAGKVKIALTLPVEPPIRYPVAPITQSTHPAEAQKFVDFIRSEQARKILARHGFTPP